MSNRYGRHPTVQPRNRPDKQTELQRLAYQQKADQRQQNSLKKPVPRKPPSRR